MPKRSWQVVIVKIISSVSFYSQTNIEKKSAATAEAAVTEDKCRAEAGCRDSDDSV